MDNVYLFVTTDGGGKPCEFIGRSSGPTKEAALHKLKKRRNARELYEIVEPDRKLYGVQVERGDWGKPLIHTMLEKDEDP